MEKEFKEKHQTTNQHELESVKSMNSLKSIQSQECDEKAEAVL